MTAKTLLSLATSCTLGSVLLSSAMATPVNLADVEGKKICWSNGNISSFLPDGKYSSPLIGDGTWTWTAKGIEIHTSMLGVVLDVDKQPDGTFKSKIENATGKYCE